MSIKNIIQQENDLQEISQQSLANYLNNPTGQYNPYLVAGELQRKEQFAQRQMVEAPQETVVDELVQKTMPMGGMPSSGMPMGGMPMPRPQETMVSDTITETGIASLPAPNIGQNYAEGGIIGYDDGGGVSGGGAFEDEIELGKAVMEMAEDPSVVAEVGGTALMKTLGIASPYIKGLGLAGLFYSPELGSAEDPNFAEKLEKYGTPVQNYKGGGRVRFGEKVIDYGAKKVEKIKDLYKNFTKKKATTPPASKKKLTKKEQDAFLKQQKNPSQTALEKANQFKKPSTKGPVTQGIIDAAKFVGPKIGPFVSATGRGIKNYAGELGLAGGVGLGVHALLNEGVLYGETPEETAAKKAKALYDSPAEVKKRADLVKDIANKAKEQERADALQAKRDAEAKRRAYLALALGGAKTMAGQSPYALTNVGEGVGTGVAGLVELEEADAARQATIDIAEQKYINDAVKQNQDQINEYNEFKLKLRGGDDGGQMLAILNAKLEDKGIDPSDVSNPEYMRLEYETIVQLYPSMVPKGITSVGGQPFIEV